MNCLFKSKRTLSAALCGLAFLTGCSDVNLDANENVIVEELSSSSHKQNTGSSGQIEAESSSELNEAESSSSEKSKIESSTDSIPETIGTSSSSEISLQDYSSSSNDVVSSSSWELVAEKLYDMEVRSYQYEFGGLDFLQLRIVNNEEFVLDSVELRLYAKAKPEEIKVVAGVDNKIGSCPLLVDADICQAYDENGFNQPCLGKNGEYADASMRGAMREVVPLPLTNSYDPVTGESVWVITVPLASAVINSKSSMRLDVGFSYGIYANDWCETFRQPAKKRFLIPNEKDWSWMPHSADVDGIDYVGMPQEDKDYGDVADVPINPFIAVYRNGVRIWGNPPKL